MNTPLPNQFRCSACGAVFHANHPFCGACGAEMSTRRSPTAATRPIRDIASARAGRERLRTLTLRPGQNRRTDVRAAAEAESFDSSSDVYRLGDSQWHQRRHKGSSRDVWLGRLIDHRYRVVEVIGHGGMGVVYKVKHQRMGKFAAMKVLHSDLAQDEEVIGRFHREAEAVSRLNHPNTVQVFDFGQVEGSLYLIMEYVRGPDLGSLVKRAGPLPFARAAPIIGQICNSLREAHAMGVIHRDLKPENILVTRTHGGRDFVKVLDFGLAKLTEREELAEVTDRGSIIGTPYYMSPEQIRGESRVDARSDIYSLGALMYRIITGAHAFTAKTPVGVLTKHLTARLVLPSERRPELNIHPRVDELIALAMRKNANERFPHVEALTAELEATYSEVCSDSSVGMPGLLAVGATIDRPNATSVLNDHVDYGIDSEVRLVREDIDGFEKALKRRRLLGAAAVPITLLAIVLAVTYLAVMSPESPQTHETESNDGIESATPINVDSDVRGYLGKRISRTEPDRDYFRVLNPPLDAEIVTVHVSAIPNIDIDLEILDPNGKSITLRDEGAMGEDEIIRRVRVGSSGLLVRISQALPALSRLPVENVSDSYILRVEYEKSRPTMDVEPNDTADNAVRITAAREPISGYLDQRKDVDVFVFQGEAGDYTLIIDGARLVPLLWRIGEGEPTAERIMRVSLQPGDLIRLWRDDQDLEHELKLPGRADPYRITLRQ